VTIARTVQYERPAAAQALKPRGVLEQCPDGAEDEEDGDEDSEDEAGGAQPQPPLRSMEDVPRAPPGALHPSLGSDGHAAGTCKRCCFFPRGRCTNGYECEFCHHPHEKRKRKNKKKKKKEAAAVGTAATGTAVLAGGPIIMQQTYVDASGAAMAPMASPAQLVTYQTMDGRPLQAASAVPAAAPQGTVMFTTAQQQLQPCVVYAAPVMVMQGATQPAPMQTYVQQSPAVQGQVLMPQGATQVGTVLSSQPQMVPQAPPQAPPVIQTVSPVLSSPAPQAPPQAAPTVFQKAHEPTSPPPMQSPKFWKPPAGGFLVSSGTGIPAVPPPMVSPKLPPKGGVLLGQ